jgi:hypothetical protein
MNILQYGILILRDDFDCLLLGMRNSRFTTIC